jgi:VIT1/CCC1 family predicted Fe2+/Mn2+ transporter
MTLLFTFLCVSPTIVFAVLFWLGYVSGDIQNATTPFALAMTLLALFFGSLIKQ